MRTIRKLKKIGAITDEVGDLMKEEGIAATLYKHRNLIYKARPTTGDRTKVVLLNATTEKVQLNRPRNVIQSEDGRLLDENGNEVKIVEAFVGYAYFPESGELKQVLIADLPEVIPGVYLASVSKDWINNLEYVDEPLEDYLKEIDDNYFVFVEDQELDDGTYVFTNMRYVGKRDDKGKERLLFVAETGDEPLWFVSFDVDFDKFLVKGGGYIVATVINGRLRRPLHIFPPQ